MCLNGCGVLFGKQLKPRRFWCWKWRDLSLCVHCTILMLSSCVLSSINELRGRPVEAFVASGFPSSVWGKLLVQKFVSPPKKKKKKTPPPKKKKKKKYKKRTKKNIKSLRAELCEQCLVSCLPEFYRLNCFGCLPKSTVPTMYGKCWELAMPVLAGFPCVVTAVSARNDKGDKRQQRMSTQHWIFLSHLFHLSQVQWQSVWSFQGWSLESGFRRQRQFYRVGKQQAW